MKMFNSEKIQLFKKRVNKLIDKKINQLELEKTHLEIEKEIYNKFYEKCIEEERVDSDYLSHNNFVVIHYGHEDYEKIDTICRYITGFSDISNASGFKSGNHYSYIEYQYCGSYLVRY